MLSASARSRELVAFFPSHYHIFLNECRRKLPTILLPSLNARQEDEGGGVECATDAKSPSRRKLIFMAAVRKRGWACDSLYYLCGQIRIA